ncbi:hypothetical protein [Bradyrhizobium sp. STM 3557]|uniref:hypothetical protein n=1 Tax=Bradyrhizobium sp. STM 3557 TaxID=578920 RepID=UPI00388D4526
MTAQGIAIYGGVKAWFAGCVAAVLVLFVREIFLALLGPHGITVGSLLSAPLLSVIQFTIIAYFSAIPAGIFMWAAHKLKIEFAVLFA